MISPEEEGMWRPVGLGAQRVGSKDREVERDATCSKTGK